MIDVFNDLPLNFKKIWGVDLPCKFPGEVKYGPNLKDMQKLDTLS
jgi:hypothetical protein